MTDQRVSIRKKKIRLKRRKKHIRKKSVGTLDKPRLVVFRSNKHIYAQAVDDSQQKTIAGCSTLTPSLKDAVSNCKGKVEVGKVIGKEIAKLLKAKGIERVCFDRNGKLFHGRVKALAEGVISGEVRI
ncbi:50S ribosomal protein L18 [bacterium]|nr:50S ribosomal protein L18 [bacterium]